MRKRADRVKRDGLPHLLDQCNIEQMGRCLLRLKRGEEAESSFSGQMLCAHWSRQLLMMLLHHTPLRDRCSTFTSTKFFVIEPHDTHPNPALLYPYCPTPPSVPNPCC